MLSKFEIAVIVLLIFNIGMTIYLALSHNHSNEGLENRADKINRERAEASAAYVASLAAKARPARR